MTIDHSLPSVSRKLGLYGSTMTQGVQQPQPYQRRFQYGNYSNATFQYQTQQSVDLSMTFNHQLRKVSTEESCQFVKKLMLTVDHKILKLADSSLAREESLTEMMAAETGNCRWMAPEIYIFIVFLTSVLCIFYRGSATTRAPYGVDSSPAASGNLQRTPQSGQPTRVRRNMRDAQQKKAIMVSDIKNATTGNNDFMTRF
ncbi:Adenine nucleotide translocator 1 [Artemisia annua]|uniref:Adenine nucleotide translocator 1 n=1 Tax=Artemisia annua TaxID=35608 RepID=A0A2U1MMP6_ARTAN|nr:Adenine nucleotide translocator 1 [Artemisia annua]